MVDLMTVPLSELFVVDDAAFAWPLLGAEVGTPVYYQMAFDPMFETVNILALAHEQSSMDLWIDDVSVNDDSNEFVGWTVWTQVMILLMM